MIGIERLLCWRGWTKMPIRSADKETPPRKDNLRPDRSSERGDVAILAEAELVHHLLVEQILYANFMLQEVDELVNAALQCLRAVGEQAVDPEREVRNLLKLLRYCSRSRASRDRGMRKLVKATINKIVQDGG